MQLVAAQHSKGIPPPSPPIEQIILPVQEMDFEELNAPDGSSGCDEDDELKEAD